MTGSVFVPEKVLEHWASQYVLYRYRSKVALWWPARGEDIKVGWLPPGPGKGIQLEMKTATMEGQGYSVKVDLGQLWEYQKRPLALQPFYVFPFPQSPCQLHGRPCQFHGKPCLWHSPPCLWHDRLENIASYCGQSVSELAFARSGRGLWFADWLVVLPTADVAAVLAKDLKMHGRRDRGVKKPLVHFSRCDPQSVRWGTVHSPLVPPPFIKWRDFWIDLESCGQPEWPQFVRVPREFLPEGYSSIARRQLLAALRNAGHEESRSPRRFDDIVTFAPNVDDQWTVMQLPDQEVDEPRDMEGEEEYRQIVFVDAAALSL
jgi:hypothetical protein